MRPSQIVPLAAISLFCHSRYAAAADDLSLVDAASTKSDDAAAPDASDSGNPDAGTSPAVATPTSSAPPPIQPVRTASPSSVLPMAESGPPSQDKWPIEYVLRPQTIPAGRLQAVLSVADSIVDSGFRSPSGVAYHGFVRAGGTMTFGETDRVQFSAYVPRLLCDGSGSPSGCSDYARINGSGFGFRFGVLRTPGFQVAFESDLSIVVTNPLTFAVDAGVRTKWLIGRRVALEVELDASKWLAPPSGYEYQAVGYGTAILDLNVQVSRHLLIWADVIPNTPLDRLGEPRMEPFGGVSWTFENAVQLAASGGVYNILGRHAWDISLPGRFFTLSVLFWI
jgi:hypothetical protein